MIVSTEVNLDLRSFSPYKSTHLFFLVLCSTHQTNLMNKKWCHLQQRRKRSSLSHIILSDPLESTISGTSDGPRDPRTHLIYILSITTKKRAPLNFNNIIFEIYYFSDFMVPNFYFLDFLIAICQFQKLLHHRESKQHRVQ